MDFQLPVMSDSFHVSVLGFPVPENMGVAVGISLLSFLQTWIWGSSGLAAAILDVQLPVTSDSFHISVIGFPVPENMGVAVGISLLYCLQA